MIEWFRQNKIDHSYPIRAIYTESGISKQAHSQTVKRLKRIEQRIPYYEGMIVETREIHPGMGLRTIYEKMEPQGIGRDHFISLGIRLGLCVNPALTNGKRTTYVHPGTRYVNLLGGIDFTDVNQVWATDITYYKIGEQDFYISFIMDLYSRRILAHIGSDNLRAETSVKVLQMALDRRGIEDYLDKLIHHSDRGSQYVSEVYTGLLTSCNIRISMCSNVYENTIQERVNRTIKNQYLKHWDIRNRYELAQKLDKAVFAYNYDKPHSSLYKMTPVEYENHLLNVPQDLRTKMRIYTSDKRLNNVDPNQIKMF